MPKNTEEMKKEILDEFDRKADDEKFEWEDYGCDGADGCCGRCGGSRFSEDKMRKFLSSALDKLQAQVEGEVKGEVHGIIADFHERFDDNNLEAERRLGRKLTDNEVQALSLGRAQAGEYIGDKISLSDPLFGKDVCADCGRKLDGKNCIAGGVHDTLPTPKEPQT